jgi:muramoyltetrapeptide carboxypeptidase LdcA involved in peptidoglycan recycling
MDKLYCGMSWMTVIILILHFSLNVLTFHANKEVIELQ